MTIDGKHPSEYPSFTDIPEGEKPAYKPVEGGGFVYADAPDTPEEARGEAQIENNLHELGGLMKERERDIRLWLETLRNTDVLPPLTPDERGQIEKDLGFVLPETAPQDRGERQRVMDTLRSFRERHEERLKKLETHHTAVDRIVRQYHITDTIDQEFVEDVIFYVNLWGGPSATAEQSHEEAGHERQFVEEAVTRLRQRIARRKYERAGEEVKEVRTSGNRLMRIRVSEKGNEARMDFSPFTDFNRQQVQLGPEAVVQILGGRFTAEDYEAIANALLTTEGPVGDACRRYAEACHTWAKVYIQKSPEEPAARSHRREASWKLMSVFGSKDPSISPLTDVPLNAIFYTVKQRFPQLASKEVPQPFVE